MKRKKNMLKRQATRLIAADDVLDISVIKSNLSKIYTRIYITEYSYIE